MIQRRNVSLKTYNTFGIDLVADTVVHLKKEEDAVSVFSKISYDSPAFFILGGGSNILFTENYKGTIIRPEIMGITIEETDSHKVVISAGAGVIWDDLVNWTVEKGFGGLENLSLIPGTTGAAPVQNIGAYGAEAGEFIERVDAVSTSEGRLHTFENADCRFGYRSSIFKKELKNKYLVTRVYFSLLVKPEFRLEYGALKEETGRLGEPSLANIRRAVINIRSSKLPDTAVLGNAGSFFKNPVISASMAEAMLRQYPLLPVFDDKPGFKKIAAAWLIEQCGWKGKRIGDAGVHDKQALVLVNYGKATGMDIFNLSEEIKQSVENKFGIRLDREVEIIGAI